MSETTTEANGTENGTVNGLVFEGDSKAISTMGVDTNNLREIGGWDDAAALFEGAVVAVPEILGDGFTLVTDKRQLLDTEMLVVNHRFVKGDHGDGGYSIVHVVTRDGRKLLFLDGSSGVHEQFKELHGRNLLGNKALHVPGGLRASEYEVIIPNEKTGKPETKKAVTFYLSTTAK